MSEEEFWRTTPRKFRALVDAAMEYKQAMFGYEKREEPQFGYIDQISGW